MRLIVSATMQQGGHTDCWSLQQSCGVLVCIVWLTVIATVQQVKQTESWSFWQLCCVPSVLWGLLLVQQGSRYGRLTVGHYSNFTVQSLYCRLTVNATWKQVGQTDCCSL